MSIDAVKDAVDTFNEIYKLLASCTNKPKISRSLRSRSREIPEMISEYGIIPILSFCYAKAGNDTYRKVLNAINSMNCNLDDSEDVGYALYLYAILKEIKKFGLIGNANEQDPLNFISTLSNEPEKLIVIEKLLYPYLIQFKRLCEAVIVVEA